MKGTPGNSQVDTIRALLSLNAAGAASIIPGLAKLGVFVVTDSAFAGGAKGDGVHDDTAAFQAFINTLIANPGSIGFVPLASAFYPISSELQGNGPYLMIGGSNGLGEQPILRATAAMRSLLTVRNTFGIPAGAL